MITGHCRTTMASLLNVFLLLLVVGMTISSPWCSAFITTQVLTTSSSRSFIIKPLNDGYIPDGMSKEQWRKVKEQEKKAKSNKDFGAYGPSTFQSRSLRAFQQDLERGKAGHLMPMFNAKEKLKSGKIKQEDIPYMQRGGSWDNADVKGAKKKSWTAADKTYNARWKPVKPDWTGTVERKGPKKQEKQETKSTKKLFGLF